MNLPQDKSRLPTKRQFKSAVWEIVKASLGLAADAGLPGSGALVPAAAESLARLINENQGDALKACEEDLAARLGDVEGLVAAQGVEIEELRVQATLMASVVNKAGWCPYREIREALGRFAARLNFTDPTEITLLEIADLLSGMTALDYDFLAAVADYQAAGVRHFLITDAEIHPAFDSFESEPGTYGACLAPLFHLHLKHAWFSDFEVHADEEGVHFVPARLESIADRLLQQRLIRSHHSLQAVAASGDVPLGPVELFLTPRGETLLELSRKSPAEFHQTSDES